MLRKQPSGAARPARLSLLSRGGLVSRPAQTVPLAARSVVPLRRSLLVSGCGLARSAVLARPVRARRGLASG